MLRTFVVPAEPNFRGVICAVCGLDIQYNRAERLILNWILRPGSASSSIGFTAAFLGAPLVSRELVLKDPGPASNLAAMINLSTLSAIGLILRFRLWHACPGSMDHRRLTYLLAKS
jgi:hypothetical protein